MPKERSPSRSGRSRNQPSVFSWDFQTRARVARCPMHSNWGGMGLSRWSDPFVRIIVPRPLVLIGAISRRSPTQQCPRLHR